MKLHVKLPDDLLELAIACEVATADGSWATLPVFAESTSWVDVCPDPSLSTILTTEDVDWKPFPVVNSESDDV